jgi:Immunoglobulin-like domain of bacterial spore germination
MRSGLATAAVLLAGFALAVPAAAPQPTPLTATGIRIASHPGFVRVVVDFNRRVNPGEVVATDPSPFRDGRVRLPLTHRGVRTTAASRQAVGVSATIVKRSGRIVIRLAAQPRRFKYAGYRALRSPHRLVIDLYKSKPPSAAAEILRAPDGCIALQNFAVGPRRVSASGRERNLFEHSLVVRLRRAGGRVHREKAATAANRRWSTTFRYPRTRRRTGTLEAVALSAKDGTLDCLTQVRVRFGGR